MLGLIVFVAIEAVLRITLSRLSRIGQHDGAVVQEILDLAVEHTSLDIDVLRTGCLYIRTELIVGTRLVDILLHQHVETAVSLRIKAEAQSFQTVLILHRCRIDDDKLCLVVCGNEESVTGLHRKQVVVHISTKFRADTSCGLVVVEHLTHGAHVIID